MLEVALQNRCIFLNTLNNINGKIFLIKNGEFGEINRLIYIEA